jgi:hypothetical protein
MRPNSFLSVACIVVFALAAPLATAETGTPIVWPVLVLGRIEGRTSTGRAEVARKIEYEATVICEYRGQISPGTKIKIRGERRLQGSECVLMPLWAPGTHFLMRLDKTAEDNVFMSFDPYIGSAGFWLPIGTSFPSSVLSDQVSDLKEALLAYGKAPRRTNDVWNAVGRSSGAWNREENLRALDEKNYFLWAWAATDFAQHAQGTADTGFLLRMLEESLEAASPVPSSAIAARPAVANESMCKALWIAHCLSDIDPVKRRPTDWQLDNMIAESLQIRLGIKKEGINAEDDGIQAAPSPAK